MLHEDLAALDRALDLEMKMLSAPDDADHDLEIEHARKALAYASSAMSSGWETMKRAMQKQGRKVLEAAKAKQAGMMATVRKATQKVKEVYDMLKEELEGIYNEIKANGLSVRSALEYLKRNFIEKHEEVMMEFIKKHIGAEPTVGDLERWEAEDAQSLERLEGDELDLYLERRMYPKGGCIKGLVTMAAAALYGMATYVEGGICFAWGLGEHGEEEEKKVVPRVKFVIGTGLGVVGGLKVGANLGAGVSVGIGVPTHCVHTPKSHCPDHESCWDECLGGGNEVERSQMILLEGHVGELGGFALAGFIETERWWPLIDTLHGVNMVGAEAIWGTHVEALPVGGVGMLLSFKTTSAPTVKALRLPLFGENILQDELETFGGMRRLSSNEAREMSLTYTSKCSYKTPIKDKKGVLFWGKAWSGERGCRACVGSYTTLWYGRNGKKRGKYRCRWWAESGSKGSCSVWKREATADYKLPEEEWDEGDEKKEVHFDEYCPESSDKYTPPEGDEEGGSRKAWAVLRLRDKVHDEDHGHGDGHGAHH